MKTYQELLELKEQTQNEIIDEAQKLAAYRELFPTQGSKLILELYHKAELYDIISDVMKIVPLEEGELEVSGDDTVTPIRVTRTVEDCNAEETETSVESVQTDTNKEGENSSPFPTAQISAIQQLLKKNINSSRLGRLIVTILGAVWIVIRGLYEGGFFDGLLN